MLVADLPADGADDRVCNEHRRNERAERHDDHADDFGTDLLKEFLQIDQNKAGQNRGDDLALVADHLYLGKAEVPNRDFAGRGGRD